MAEVNKRITLLPGDGIGPEIVEEARRLLEEVGRHYGQTLELQTALIGGIAIDEAGSPLPEETLRICEESDAILLGAVGGPRWDNNPPALRPEAGLLAIRKRLGLFANLRPITVDPSLVAASTLKPEVLDGVDILILRELTGGLYFGTPRGREMGPEGLEVVDTLRYTEVEMERIIRLAFETARVRRGKVTSVDKANVLESSRLWRETAERIGEDYPDVTLSHMLVDTAAMQLVRRPAQFDVLVTENLFGDILSDEAAMITGSIGMLPSASLGQGGLGMYEPIHGSAPDIAGKNVANPLATFLSVALMFRYSLQLPQAAIAVEQAVRAVLAVGHRSGDIAGPGDVPLTTTEMGLKVREALSVNVPHCTRS